MSWTNRVNISLEDRASILSHLFEKKKWIQRSMIMKQNKNRTIYSSNDLLVSKRNEFLSIKHRRLLNQNHSIAVRGVDRDVVRDSSEHLFLESPGARVERMADSPKCEAPVR